MGSRPIPQEPGGGAGRGRHRGLMLVELLLVVVIIALVAGAYYGLGRKGSEEEEGATTTPGQALEAAKSVECANNLRQLRMIMQAEQSIEGDNPRKFDAEAGGALTHCPVSGQAYQYDPNTGRIWCTTPGHESF